MSRRLARRIWLLAYGTLFHVLCLSWWPWAKVPFLGRLLIATGIIYAATKTLEGLLARE